MKSPKKLCVGFLFDDTLDSSDGVAQYVKILGEWLSSQGHSVCYLVGETKLQEWAGGPVYSLSKNQTVYFNGNKLSVPRPASRRKIKEVLHRQHLDVLHVMVPYSPMLAKRVIEAADPRTVIIGTFHIFPAGQMSRLGSRALAAWLSSSLRRFNAIVSVSQAAADFAQAIYGINSSVIPNPVDISQFKTSSDRPDTGQKIVFLGRLVKRKGARQLIEAFAVLKKRLPRAQLIIAGDGPQRPSLQKLVRRLKMINDIEFTGYITENEKPALLASAAVACFPSLYGEAFGIVLIEAMASAGPVVLAGNNPGYRSVLGERSELLADPNKVDELADRLHLLLSNKKLRQNLVGWQVQAVKQYDVNVVGRQILNLYSEQIARRIKTRNNKAHGLP